MSRWVTKVIFVGLTIAACAAAPVWATGITERVSVGPGGAQGNGESSQPALSADGRFVGFQSFATNLVPDDTNRSGDAFVRDRQTGVTTRVSVGPGGAQANFFSAAPALSADGRIVAFGSVASNLVPGDSNDIFDVFVRDLRTGVTRRVSVGPGGAQANGESFAGPLSLSADGRFVAFDSRASNLVLRDTNGVQDVFVRDRRADVTRRVSVGRGGAQANGFSSGAAISADGRFVAFFSEASNLVPGDTNGVLDAFVRDRRTDVTRRVSVGRGGAQANSFSAGAAISADGRFVAFISDASNLVPPTALSTCSSATGVPA
jgi:Tol biopolymer transport system component